MRVVIDGAAPIELRVLESGDRCGGVIHTEQRDGYVIERGADSFITNKPWAAELCGALGLQERLVPTDARFRRTFVVRRGKLVEVPDGFLLLAPARLWPVVKSPVFSWRGKLRMGLDLVLPRRTADSEESLADFVTRRLGREALERLVQPLVANIYTADPAQLSLRATMPQFVEMERAHRSLIRAAGHRARTQRAEAGASGARFGLFMTVDSGLQTMVDEIERRLPEGVVQTRCEVTRVTRADGSAQRGARNAERSGHGLNSALAGDGAWCVHLADGSVLHADAVVLAVPAHAAARLVEGVDAELAGGLGQIGYASTAIVLLGYRREQVAHPLNGFGFVVPAVEGRCLLGCSFPSIKFPRRAAKGEVIFRAFLGGALQPELLERDDAALADLAERELRELLGITGEPVLRLVQRHEQAMPQYHVGHLQRVADIERRSADWPGLELAGNAYHGVGIPDCIHSGQQAADRVLATLQSGKVPIGADRMIATSSDANQSKCTQ
jgi:oxygen-dependent protoporphyrinogen oxidase